MLLYPENPGLYAIINACLTQIKNERPYLRKTKSQIPATSELWFLESGLKMIKSDGELLTWIKETFSPQLNKQRSNLNVHVARIFESLAIEIINQLRQSDHYDQETRDSIEKLIGSECPLTPIIKNCPDENVIDQNWSDTINIMKNI